MNRLIVDVLADLMWVVAIGIIVVGAVLGYRHGVEEGVNLTAASGFGFLAGTLAALVVCGLLSSLILVENHLRYIADDIDAMREAELGSEGDLDDIEAAENEAMG